MTKQFHFTDLNEKSIQKAEVEYCAFFNNKKHAEYDFLSNFYPHPVASPYGVFQCAEGLYQFLKFKYLHDPEIKKQFINATGQEAWDLSHSPVFQKKIDPKWDREAAMQETLHLKFSDNELKNKLLSTGNKYLVENSPNGHDSFWSDNGDGTGKNKLGILLMALRQEFGGTGVVPRPAILYLFYAHQCDFCTRSSHFTNQGMFYNYCDAHMTHELILGRFKKEIHLSDIPTGTASFLYFEINQIPELVEEGARLIAEHIKSLNLENPFFVTPEASTFVIAHLLRTKYGIPGLVISKQRKPTDFEIYHIDYVLTSTEKKSIPLSLYLNHDHVKQMAGKDIVIVDSVCSSGETLGAVYALLLKSKISQKNIKKAIVLFTEGEDFSSIDISEDIRMPLHRFCHLPLYPKSLSSHKNQCHLYSVATIPTTRGLNTLAVFQTQIEGQTKDAIAYYPPTTFNKGYENIPVRVHDACATSELFDSVKCDCKLQLDFTKNYIAEYGGIIIYLNQEGRGIGLGKKMAAYHLQQTQGLDTVEANRALGLPDDTRQYEAVKEILKILKVKSIQLITNNPFKVSSLSQLGIQVNGTIACVVEPQSESMRFYMETKAKQMQHKITISKGKK